ncbi:hypothetical protein B0A52_09803 [Exophiala mesophila]|uniref:Autophagy-related protein 29 n=1 Tax=Exophiala mesophila TaxID=212818 RepID=A0A438MS73_EXOME|nr:hypothetical protein B0A52_09803 [Exophiala mesophila]
MQRKDDGFDPTPTYGPGYVIQPHHDHTYVKEQKFVADKTSQRRKNEKGEVDLRRRINISSDCATDRSSRESHQPHSMTKRQPRQIPTTSSSTSTSTIPSDRPHIAPARKGGLYIIADTDLSLLPITHPDSPAYRGPPPPENNITKSSRSGTTDATATPSTGRSLKPKAPHAQSSMSTHDSLITNNMSSPAAPTMEDHFTVFVRLPYKRGSFTDPPPVSWSAAKERALWDILSRQSKSNEMDWKSMAERFQVTEKFLLQQAAWLYERQLSQVRAQMRKVGNRQSATPSPAPGSASTSMVGGQAMKRAGSGGSRVPSRLSTQAIGSPIIGAGDSTPGTPAKSRTSLPFRASSGTTNVNLATQSRTSSSAVRPLSRQSSKDNEPGAVFPPTQSRRGSMQHQILRSPILPRSGPSTQQTKQESSDSEEDLTQSRNFVRRPNPSSIHRRAVSLRKEIPSQHTGSSTPIDQASGSPIPPQHNQDQEDDDDDEDEDGPSFLPFVAPAANPTPNKARPSSSSQQDPSATLRGTLYQLQTQNVRPTLDRRGTSERINSPTVEPPTPRAKDRANTEGRSPSLGSPTTTTTQHGHPGSQGTGTSSGITSTRPLSSPLTRQAPSPTQHRTPLTSTSSRPTTSNSHVNPRSNLTTATSNNSNNHPGSDTSPSMGSSFSDLEDASVTQSALEEALMSGIGNTASIMTVGSTSTSTHPNSANDRATGPAAVAGRATTGIAQALRSRYFDGRDRR